MINIRQTYILMGVPKVPLGNIKPFGFKSIYNLLIQKLGLNINTEKWTFCPGWIFRRFITGKARIGANQNCNCSPHA